MPAVLTDSCKNIRDPAIATTKIAAPTNRSRRGKRLRNVHQPRMKRPIKNAPTIANGVVSGARIGTPKRTPHWATRRAIPGQSRIAERAGWDFVSVMRLTGSNGFHDSLAGLVSDREGWNRSWSFTIGILHRPRRTIHAVGVAMFLIAGRSRAPWG